MQDGTGPGRESGLRFYVMNAFILDEENSLKQGNPAAIVLLPPSTGGLPLSDDLMQSIAAQINLSETAFVEWSSSSTLTEGQRQDPFRIRWFTPTCEVDLCGHATLAAAAVLLSAGTVSADETVRLKTLRKGTLEVRFEKRPGLGPNFTFAKMTFPIIHARQTVSEKESETLMQALGVRRSTKKALVYRSEYDLVVELPSSDDIALLAPDMQLLRRIDTRGVIVCAKKAASLDRPVENDVVMVSRFFAPRAGIPEDPVTGSAHCVLASLYLTPDSGGVFRQLSHRGGRLELFRRGTNSVEIGGKSRLVASGSLYV